MTKASQNDQLIVFNYPQKTEHGHFPSSCESLRKRFLYKED